MKKETNKALQVGILVFSALLIFTLAIYFIGSKENLFSSSIKIKCIFEDIRGVTVGNNVRFSGINVGTVKNITMTSDSTVVLTLSLKEDYANYIYKNSVVDISQEGLMGSKMLTIASGTPDAGRIQEGDFLKTKNGIDIQDMLKKTQAILVDANEAVSSLKSIAQKIDQGDGDISRLLNSNDLTTQLNTTTQRLNSALASIDRITQKINQGQGDLGKLISNNEITEQTYTILSNLKQTGADANRVVGKLESAADNINNGDGTISLLLNNKQTARNVDTTIVNLNNSLDQFNKTAKAIEESWIVRLFSKKKNKEKKQTEVKPDTTTMK